MPGIACKIDPIIRRKMKELTLATITSLTVSTKQIQKVHLFDIGIGSDLKICVKELMVDFFTLSENSWIPAVAAYDDTTLHPVSTWTFCRLCFFSNTFQPQVSTNVKVPTSQCPVSPSHWPASVFFQNRDVRIEAKMKLEQSLLQADAPFFFAQGTGGCWY